MESTKLNSQTLIATAKNMVYLTPEERVQAVATWEPSMSKSSEDGKIGVIDFFSGCGGMSLGFDALAAKGAPFQVLAGIDINDQSLESYSRNFGVPAINQDISKIPDFSDHEFKGFLSKIGLDVRPEKLVVIGCAPCQGFSAHTKTNMSRVDSRNNLVVKFALTAVKLEADVIVMENVPELLSGRFSHFFDEFKEIVEGYGYHVSSGIHNAAEYGVPQKRLRAIVVASKGDLPDFQLPTLNNMEQKNVIDAIGNLPPVDAGEICVSDSYHRSARHRQATIEVIKQVPHDGGSRPEGVGPQCLDKVNGFSDVYGRLSWNKPSITITHYSRNPASGRFVHPSQDRGLTMREVARLQSFPDSFLFAGKNDDVYRQIGEAVPPVMSSAVAEYVLQCVDSLK